MEILSWFRRRREKKIPAPSGSIQGVRAYYWDGAAPASRPVKDLTMKGAYVVTPDQWYVGTILALTLQCENESTSERDSESVTVPSRVHCVDGNGFAVSFVFRSVKERKALEQFMKSARARQSAGQAVLPLVALSAVVLLGFAGLGADVGALFREKRIVQTAADSAAIAGASRLKYTVAPTVATAAQADAALNGMSNGVNGATVTVNNPPLAGPHSGNGNYVEAVVAQSSPTYFMKVFGWNPVTVKARAVATLGTGNGCIVTLGTSGTGFSNSGNTTLSASACGVSVNSGSNGAMSVNGNVTIDVATIGVVGTYSQSGRAASVSPTPTQGVAPVADPLGYLTPPSGASCPGGVTYSGGSTVSPGLYCGGISIGSHSNVTFNSGTYLMGGNLSISGNPTINGTGVTFYFFGTATINMTGGGTLNLAAPTSGTYNGILFYQNPSDTQTASFGGNASGTVAGVFYLPGASLSFQGTSGATFYTSIVAKSVSLGGTPNLLNYATLNGSSPITAATLVE